MVMMRPKPRAAMAGLSAWNQGQRAGDGGAELRVQRLGREGLDGVAGIAVEAVVRQRIVDQRGRRAPGRVNPIQHGPHAGRGAHIALDGQGPVAQPGGQRLGLVFAVAVVDRNACAFSGKGVGNGRPEAAAGAGDEHDLVGKGFAHGG